MPLLRLSAFSDGDTGGNPAGVHLSDALPPAGEMQRIAAEVGYSETAFAAPDDGGWRVRYFAPAAEVPFCGHATLALGAALAMRHGDGAFPLQLNAARITVRGATDGPRFRASLAAPPTRSEPMDAATLASLLGFFGYEPGQLDPRLPPARIHGGADHLLLALRTRADLAAMRYDFAPVRDWMLGQGLVTVMLAVADADPRRFHVRNAFAAGGVAEDPATGAAAAAFGGYLRARGWPHGGRVVLHQGDDMGQPSRLDVAIPPDAGAPIEVSGTVRRLG